MLTDLGVGGLAAGSPVIHILATITSAGLLSHPKKDWTSSSCPHPVTDLTMLQTYVIEILYCTVNEL